MQNTIADLPQFRQKQIFKAVFNEFVSDWSEVTTLAKDLRARLNNDCPLPIKAEEMHSKGTVKAAIDLGDTKVETVLMQHQDRNTVCISTQAGCPMGCAFCATGQAGFVRNLMWWEMVLQVLYFNRQLKLSRERVTNVVFMGMGEPFLNYDEVIKAIEKLNDPDTFNIGSRRISVSTVGIIPGIQRLSQERFQVNLAVSLHAPDDQLRSSIMPVNEQYPLAKLLKSVREYLDMTKRKVMIEYLLIDRVNDSAEQAQALADLLHEYLGGLFTVNLIRYNQTGSFRPSPAERIREFKKILEDNRIETVERYRFGHNIKAACGQLAGGK